MQKWLTSAGVGASLLVLTGAAYADGYSAPRAYERPFSWTGLYIGAQGGSGWGTSEDSLTSLQACVGGVCGPVTPFTPGGLLRDSNTINGFHGGGTAGYNLQTGPVVLGVEGDISAANIDGDGNCNGSFGAATNTLVAPPPTFAAHCRTSLDWFATLTGRLGVASGNALVYAKAGVAWGGFNRDVDVGVNALGPGGVVVLRGSNDETRTGFVLGSGIEYALRGGWSAKVEYDFMDFGKQGETADLFIPGTNVHAKFRLDDDEQVHIVRIGLNYRFGEDRYVAPLK